MDDVAISVIIPIYNVKEYLDDCLKSIEDQTFKDIEVILINDGSTDGSEDIAQIYEKRHENFKLVNQQNKGLSAARNTGLNYAEGKYIYFIDSDDYLISTALEELYRKAEEESLDVLKFSAYTFRDDDTNGLIWGNYKYRYEYNNTYTGIEFLNLTSEREENEFPSSCMVFIRRTIIEKYELRFYEGIIHEDNLFCWKLMAVSKRVGVLNKPLYCRRIREGSIMKTLKAYDIWKSFLLSAVDAEEFYCKHVELKGSGIEENYHNFLFKGIFLGYMVMDKSLRKRKEVKEFHRMERKLIFKWRDRKNKKLLLYAIKPEIYICYENMVKKLCAIKKYTEV